MTDWVMRHMGLERAAAEALRDGYWRDHGTTLAGLMTHHGTEPQGYLADVHDIDLSVLAPDPDLAAAIAALPGRKIIHTNADAAYAGRVLGQRGLDKAGFEAIFGIGETGYHPKPDPRAYETVLAAQGIDPRRAAFFEDDPRNLVEPHRLGMVTVLIEGGHHGPDPAPAGYRAGPHVLHQTDDLTAFLRPLASCRGPSLQAQ